MQGKVLVTGGSGFIGTILLEELVNSGYSVVSAVRTKGTKINHNVQEIIVGNIDSTLDWTSSLTDVKVVIHLAARAHILKDDSSDPLAIYRETNTYGTINLARQAANAGVKRFIYISSIGVNGTSTSEAPFSVNDTPNPITPYAISKYEAERGLHEIAENSAMEVAIIRPPLVYGANAPGTFGKLINILAKGTLLPFASINNKRSFIYVKNLTNFIIFCIKQPTTSSQTFLISDGEDYSTPEFIRKLTHALGKPDHLFPFPQVILTYLLRFIGKGDAAHSLCENLQIETSMTRDEFSWTPPYTVDDALIETALEWLGKNNSQT